MSTIIEVPPRRRASHMTAQTETRCSEVTLSSRPRLLRPNAA